MPREVPALLLAGSLAAGIWISQALGWRCAPGALAAGLLVGFGVLPRFAPRLSAPSRRARAFRTVWETTRRPAAALLVGIWRGSSIAPEAPMDPEAEHPIVSARGVIDMPPIVFADEAAERPPSTLFSLAGQLRVRVRVNEEVAWLRGGHRIRATGRLLPPLGRRNPGDPVGPAEGLLIVRSSRDIVPDPSAPAPFLPRCLGFVRGRCTEIIRAIHRPELEGLILAMVLGDRRLLSEAAGDALMGTGTYHLLAISGFHVVAIVFIALRLPVPRRIAGPIRWAVIAGFTVLTGASPPVVRAATMFAVHELLVLARRASSGLNVLGASALVMLAVSPDLLFDVGFQLSFLAVLAILTWGERLRAGRGTFGAALAVSLATNVGTAPLTALYFQRLHPLGPIWNLLAAPLTLVTFLGGTLSLTAGLVHLPLGRAVASLVDAAAACLLGALAIGARVPGSSFLLPSPPPVLIAASLLTLGAGWVLRKRKTAFASAAALLSCASAFSLGAPKPAEVVLFDAGEGQAALVSIPGSWPILVDAGARGPQSSAGRRLSRAILAAGFRRLEAALLTHAHDDHTKAFPGLLDLLPVERLWLSPFGWKWARGAELSCLAKDRGLNVEEVERGTRIEFPRSPDFWLEVLHPDGREQLLDPRRQNDLSVVLRLHGPGSCVLFLSDLEDRGLARLLGTHSDLAADVLVAPHHGRPCLLWPSVLERVRPKCIVFSSGGSKGARETCRRAEEKGFRACATWRGGAIRIVWKPGEGWATDYWYRRR